MNGASGKAHAGDQGRGLPDGGWHREVLPRPQLSLQRAEAVAAAPDSLGTSLLRRPGGSYPLISEQLPSRRLFVKVPNSEIGKIFYSSNYDYHL